MLSLFFSQSLTHLSFAGSSPQSQQGPRPFLDLLLSSMYKYRLLTQSNSWVLTSIYSNRTVKSQSPILNSLELWLYNQLQSCHLCICNIEFQRCIQPKYDLLSPLYFLNGKTNIVKKITDPRLSGTDYRCLQYSTISYALLEPKERVNQECKIPFLFAGEVQHWPKPHLLDSWRYKPCGGVHSIPS